MPSPFSRLGGGHSQQMCPSFSARDSESISTSIGSVVQALEVPRPGDAVEVDEREPVGPHDLEVVARDRLAPGEDGDAIAHDALEAVLTGLRAGSPMTLKLKLSKSKG